MSDLCVIVDYITEAEHHIRQAEALLKDLEDAQSCEARRLRACMYIAAMKRLKRMIETQQPVDAIDEAPRPAATLSAPPRLRWWPVPKLAIETALFRRRTG
ncbi:hypothetical protein [Methylobacterium pseudosasicola]|uniref:Uncharacterized protein n=1 Tax=Methylobacterium pseudosasicola TaxID=582667 RepID=A0A1I4FAM5_9HYPH|nr:hypothetical protein [Methylobacterium pseudosasicola]SFL13856.1 hypothetical protein SAMN05192568_1001140 [Methylobacterium pseudosasicola]